MTYRLTDVQASMYPSEAACEEALTSAGLSIDALLAPMRTFVCPDELRAGAGYQMALAHQLETQLRRQLVDGASRILTTPQYSPRLNEAADVAVEIVSLGKRIYVEIEFRPNVEKDLVKFQIGWNTGRLLLGILVVALDRTAVNAGYTSMPEYRKFTKVIEELRPAYPLLLIGIRGEHISSPAV